MSKHQKHIKLPLRNIGKFAVNEIAILGSSCSTISRLVNTLTKDLSSYTVAYIDASHDENSEVTTLNQYTFNQNKTVSIQKEISDNHFQRIQEFSSFDLTFINGNHYQGAQQIIILDKEKEASLLKRIDQLTAVLCIIKKDENSDIFPFLKEKFPEIEELPSFIISDGKQISQFIEKKIMSNTPTLNGLVLVGGKSERMGTDKSSLNYHGKMQRDHMVLLLEKKVDGRVFISMRKEQDIFHDQLIPDTFLGLGPYGGICSAFMQYPNDAFLVVATDLPFVDEKLLELLISKRNPSKIATTFIGKNNAFPEPLITIWEPKAYPILLNYLSLGYSCPRKVLINSDVELIEIDELFLRNVNTPQDFEQAKKDLKNE